MGKFLYNLHIFGIRNIYIEWSTFMSLVIRLDQPHLTFMNINFLCLCHCHMAFIKQLDTYNLIKLDQDNLACLSWLYGKIPITA